MPSLDLNLICERSHMDASLVRAANSKEVEQSGEYVMLWMQKAQRAFDNPALDFAVEAANQLDKPLFAIFVLTHYPSATFHHFSFMLDGLRETATALRDRGIAFCIRKGQPEAVVHEFGTNAAMIIGEEGATRIELEWRRRILAFSDMPQIVFIETEAIVPPHLCYPKLAWSAAQLRARLAAYLPHFLEAPHAPKLPRRVRTSLNAYSDDTLFTLPDDRAQREIADHPLIALQRIEFTSGYTAGMSTFYHFLHDKLSRYADQRNDPNSAVQSDMSPYLHFGQVSARRLAKEALDFHPEHAQMYLEELVVRRELAINFVLFCPDYLNYDAAVPSWAKESLESTPREDLFSESAMESAATDDPYWNAAQLEMILTGKMHNYMRMYWGKKILSWFRDPHRAYSFALTMNDRYSLDGRDPNGYAGVAWCFGRHDRPWPHRLKFGSVRSMTSEGLRRKFDADLYAERISNVYNMRKMEVS